MINEQLKEIEESIEMLAVVLADLRLQVDIIKAEYLPTKGESTGCPRCDIEQQFHQDATRMCPKHQQEYEEKGNL